MNKIIPIFLLSLLTLVVSAAKIETVSASGHGETYAKAIEDARLTITQATSGRIIGWEMLEAPQLENGIFTVKLKARVDGSQWSEADSDDDAVTANRRSGKQIKSDLIMAALESYGDCYTVFPVSRIPWVDKEGRQFIYINYQISLNQEKYQAFVQQLESVLPHLGFEETPHQTKDSTVLRIYKTPRDAKYLSYYNIDPARLNPERLRTLTGGTHIYCMFELLDKSGKVVAFRRFCVMPRPLLAGGTWSTVFASLNPPAKPLMLNVDVVNFESPEAIKEVATIRTTLTFEETEFKPDEKRWISEPGWHGHRLPMDETRKSENLFK